MLRHCKGRAPGADPCWGNAADPTRRLLTVFPARGRHATGQAGPSHPNAAQSSGTGLLSAVVLVGKIIAQRPEGSIGRLLTASRSATAQPPFVQALLMQAAKPQQSNHGDELSSWQMPKTNSIRASQAAMTGWQDDPGFRPFG